MLKRRDLLRGIGALVGVCAVGKVTATQAAPVEVPPVVQTPQAPSWYGLGSIAVTIPVEGFTITGTGDIYTPLDYHELHQHYVAQRQHTWRNRTSVLGGFDDDGGEG